MAIADIEFREATVDVEAGYRDAQQLVEKYPRRGPATIAQAMRPYIDGTIVCDLGCGGGDLLWLMSRYTTKAIGVEVDPTRVKHAEARAGSTVSMEIMQLDYFKDPPPEADVYYAWPNDPHTFGAVAERLSTTSAPCVLAAGAGIDFFESERNPDIVSIENRLGQGRSCHVLSLVDRYGGEVISFPFKEDSLYPDDWSGTGHWGLALITL